MPSIHIGSCFAHQFHRKIFNVGILIIYTLLVKDSICAYLHIILFIELFMQKKIYVCYRYSRCSAQKDSILRLYAFDRWNGTERLVEN
jgi:hypothetical protein